LPNWRRELITWRKFHQEANEYGEEQLLAMLEEEKRVHKRVKMLERIHQRYCTLRTNRERLEILKEGKRP
jgi:hypothetical protein